MLDLITDKDVTNITKTEQRQGEGGTGAIL